MTVREMARLGGKTTAKKLTAEQRKEAASKAARARVGEESMISKKRKPVAIRTQCGAVSYDATVINGPCGRMIGRNLKCKGGMSNALEPPHCRN